MDEFANLPVVSGPFKLFKGAFTLEILEAPTSLDASALMRSTYHAGNPVTKMGKLNPQVPPLHLHFDQSETFRVAQGSVGLTLGWEAKDQLFTKNDGAYCIKPWTPHSFWPDVSCKEDTIVYIWAHSKKGSEEMDETFFEHLLRYISDAYENNTALDPFQNFLIMHETASALIMFPRAAFLGPLRWWIPWKFQAGFATVAKWLGYSSRIDKYVKQK